jgi:hypothetical protein
MDTERERVIPSKYIPEKGSHVEAIDGKQYLIANDAMYTFYQRTKGEFSAFFLALRDEKKLLGCKCSNCSLVRVPPFLTHCPDCNFAPTELIEVEQVGVMNTTPPITYFATSGILVPGMIKKGTEVKLVFRDRRIGEMTDVFCVPTAELSPEQIQRKGLQESEIDWESPVEPAMPEVTAEDSARYRDAYAEIRSIIEDMNRNERARKDIAGWKREVLVKTKGGEFTIVIDDGDIRIDEIRGLSPDFVMVCEDPRTLLDGLAYRGAITDAVINKRLWISKNTEFTTIFKLDRMARSVARSRKAS